MRAAALAAAGCARGAAAAYVQSDSYVGVDFFSKWSFFTGPDPTHGDVQYVDYDVASSAGLVRATADRVYIGADMTTTISDASGRRSVRIESKATFQGGIFVLSLDHIPTGCGTWPAFWMFGMDGAHPWPVWGEFDIIEGVHTPARVSTTLHATAGCDQSSIVAGKDFTGSWILGSGGADASNCDVDAAGQFFNQGCGQKGPEGSMGEGFNAQGGGTYAAEWDPVVGQHIRTWYWPAGREPPDVLKGTPEPDSWGAPYSLFSLDPAICPASHFENMRLIFDLTFCGDLGRPTFAQSCPEVASQMSCEDLVAKHPEELAEAYWSIRSLAVYQDQARLPASPAMPPTDYIWVFVVAGLLAVGALWATGRLNASMLGFDAAPVQARLHSFGHNVRLTAEECWGQLTTGLGSLGTSWSSACDATGTYAAPATPRKGERVVVRTSFEASGRYAVFGSTMLPRDTIGAVEYFEEETGSAVISFERHWGKFCVTEAQFANLEVLSVRRSCDCGSPAERRLTKFKKWATDTTEWLGPRWCMVLRAAALLSIAIAVYCVFWPRSPPGSSRCTASYQNCLYSRSCCPSLVCYEKDVNWAACLPNCEPGIHADDAPEFQSPWSCKTLTGPARCAKEFLDCRGGVPCCDASMTCFEKNANWAGCLSSCKPGVHFDEEPQYQTPWSCRTLGR